VADIGWNEQAGRFTDSRGRFVSQSAVRSVVDQIADAASERMARAAQALLDGNLSLGAFQAELQATIKLAHVSAAVIAHGGADQMTPQRWGAIGPTVKREYQYLKAFADDIASGRQVLTGMLTARARQYGQAARVTFERTYGRDQQQRGYQSERSVLSAAEHCGLCVQEAGKGWVLIGSLIPIGQRTCRAMDRCHVEYRREMAGSEAAA
jgi:hypothetical protein